MSSWNPSGIFLGILSVVLLLIPPVTPPRISSETLSGIHRSNVRNSYQDCFRCFSWESFRNFWGFLYWFCLDFRDFSWDSLRDFSRHFLSIPWGIHLGIPPITPSFILPVLLRFLSGFLPWRVNWCLNGFLLGFLPGYLPGCLPRILPEFFYRLFWGFLPGLVHPVFSEILPGNPLVTRSGFPPVVHSGIPPRISLRIFQRLHSST